MGLIDSLTTEGGSLSGEGFGYQVVAGSKCGALFGPLSILTSCVTTKTFGGVEATGLPFRYSSYGSLDISQRIEAIDGNALRGLLPLVALLCPFLLSNK